MQYDLIQGQGQGHEPYNLSLYDDWYSGLVDRCICYSEDGLSLLGDSTHPGRSLLYQNVTSVKGQCTYCKEIGVRDRQETLTPVLLPGKLDETHSLPSILAHSLHYL